MREDTARNYSVLTLAYIGDAVFELLVRTHILSQGNRPVNKMSRMAIEIVRAENQAKLYHKLLDALDEDELAVLKRGRNAKSHSHAKNASISEYRHATGVETLFGYLYMTGNSERIMELFEICLGEED